VQYIDKYIFLTGGVSESEDSEEKRESIESPVSSETCPRSAADFLNRSVADFLKSSESKRDSLEALLKEVSKVWCQYGSGLLEEEILNLLPVDKIVQCASSRLVNDTSLNIPISQYQNLLEAVAKRVTYKEFLTLYFNAAMASEVQNTGCEESTSASHL
jgi:hypothetical protein